MELKIQSDYNFKDFSDKTAVKNLLAAIDLKVEEEIILNIENCIPDYQSTSILIDYILKKIITSEENIEFIITTDLRLPKHSLMSFIFWGSEILQIPVRTPPEKVEKKIKSKLSNSGISLSIMVKDKEGKIHTTYEF